MQKHNRAINKNKIEEVTLFLREKAEDSGLIIDRKQTVAIAVLLVITIAGSLIFYMSSRPKPVEILKASENTVKEEAESKAPAKKEEVRQICVHVAGAVASPGVHRLKEGSRVVDAVAVAGGGLQDSDQNALNLAAKLSDGQRIYVPKKGEVPQQGIVSQGDGLSAMGDPLMGSIGGGKVNINLATADQLVSLSGVGPATAKKIIDHRSKHGPFKKIEDIKKVDGIGPKKYENLKDGISVD